MRAVIQRVKSATVRVQGQVVGEIGPGLLTLLGVASGDSEQDAEQLVSKILKLRIFEDDAGKMNLSLLDKKFQHLIVSQFTLIADTQKGNRPSFIEAAPPEVAKNLYERTLALSRAQGVVTQGGEFQAHMEVSLLNDGPVTFVLESKPK